MPQGRNGISLFLIAFERVYNQYENKERNYKNVKQEMQKTMPKEYVGSVASGFLCLQPWEKDLVLSIFVQILVSHIMENFIYCRSLIIIIIPNRDHPLRYKAPFCHTSRFYASHIQLFPVILTISSTQHKT